MSLLSVTFPKLGWEFNIDPIVFSIGKNISVHWYGVIIALGFALAVFYVLKNIKYFGLDDDRVIDVIMVSTIGGFIGARAYYVIFSWADYAADPLSVFSVWKGGLGIYGGIIAGFLVGFFMCKVRKISFFAMADIASLGFLIGQGIGRWGNFVNGEAFGSNTNLPWGMSGTNIQYYLTTQQETLASYGITVNPALPVHPCFLYESLWCLLGFLLLHLYKKHRKFDGEIMLMYIGWYGLGRFAIEGLRTDSLMLGQLRASQLLAALCVIAAVIIIVIIRNKVASAHDDNFMPLYVNTEISKAQLEDYLHRNTGTKEERAAYIKEANEKAKLEKAEQKAQLAEKRKSKMEAKKLDKSNKPIDKKEADIVYENVDSISENNLEKMTESVEESLSGESTEESTLETKTEKSAVELVEDIILNTAEEAEKTADEETDK